MGPRRIVWFLWSIAALALIIWARESFFRESLLELQWRRTGVPTAAFGGLSIDKEGQVALSYNNQFSVYDIKSAQWQTVATTIPADYVPRTNLSNGLILCLRNSSGYTSVTYGGGRSLVSGSIVTTSISTTISVPSLSPAPKTPQIYLIDEDKKTGSYAKGPNYDFSGSPFIALKDGRVLFIDSSKNCSVYDPVAGTWTDAPGTALGTPILTLMEDGRVFLMTGSDASIFDPKTMKWSAVSPLPTAMGIVRGGVSLADGKVMALGDHGRSNYDPRPNSWDPVAPGHYSDTPYCGRLRSGRVVYLGLETRPGLFGPASDILCKLFDEKSKLDQEVRLPPEVQYLYGALMLPNGKFMVMGISQSSNPCCWLVDELPAEK